MSTTSLNRFRALNSAAKNPLADTIELIALGVADIRSITDNQLMHKLIPMDVLANDLDRIERQIREWVDTMTDGAVR